MENTETKAAKHQSNMNQLTKTPHGLQKELGGIVMGIEKGKNTGITLYNQNGNQLLTMQLDEDECRMVANYLHNSDLHAHALDRMEELRDTIKSLIKAWDRWPTKEMAFEIEKAKKQLE